MTENKIDSEIIFAPKGFQTEFKLTRKKIDIIMGKKFSIILFQKILSGKNFHYFIEQAKKKIIKTVYLGIDRINHEFAYACDAIIVVSRALTNNLEKKHYLVFDGFEHSGEVYKKHSKKKQIKLIFIYKLYL